MSCFAGCDEPDLSPLPECPFDVVVVTAPNARAAKAYEIELPIAFERATAPRGGDAAPAALLLSVADPMGRRVGSGGGTSTRRPMVATATRLAKEASASGFWSPSVKASGEGGAIKQEGAPKTRVPKLPMCDARKQS